MTHDSGAAEIGFRRSSRGVAVPLCDEISGRQWQALPRSSLWKGRSGSKEALLVVRDLIRHERGAETAWKLHLLVRSKVSRLLKLDLLATLNELQRLDKVDLALMVISNLYPFIIFLQLIPIITCQTPHRRVLEIARRTL